jgi:hypothetical protein
MNTPTLAAGCKAYIDSFAGLIPCVVLSVHNKWEVSVKLTATRGAYKRGETITENSLHVVPRAAVHVRNGQYRIGVYSTEVTP